MSRSQFLLHWAEAAAAPAGGRGERQSIGALDERVSVPWAEARRVRRAA